MLKIKSLIPKNLNDAVINRYFERAFLSVKSKFISQNELYSNYLSLDLENENGSRLIDSISSNTKLEESVFHLDSIKLILSKSDWDFLTSFLDSNNNKCKKVVEVAKEYNISHQAVSKRLTRIKRIINESIDLFDCRY